MVNLKKTTVYVGSFKPPHKGHFHLVKTMLRMTEDPSNPENSGKVYIFISKKERDPCPGITGEVSKEVWQEYLKTLSEKDQERTKLILSKMSSPTQTAYGFVKKIYNKKEEFYLVKSAKDVGNKRFSSFKNIKGLNFYELILPGYENLNSTDMREALSKNDKKKFNTFLPKMSLAEKNKLWLKLKKLC